MPTLHSGKSVANLLFHNVSFNFATAILKFDTFSLYHIVRTRIAKVTDFFPFWWGGGMVRVRWRHGGGTEDTRDTPA